MLPPGSLKYLLGGDSGAAMYKVTGSGNNARIMRHSIAGNIRNAAWGIQVVESSVAGARLRDIDLLRADDDFMNGLYAHVTII